MIDDSLKKINRVVAILTSLQTKRIVKAQDLADRFGVSLRTIYRDVKVLESAGVPILSEAGIGYSLMDGYRLPPVMLTKEEAASLVTGEKLMGVFLDKNLQDAYKSATEKIKAVMKPHDRDWIEMLDSQVEVRANRSLFNDALPHALESVMKGVAGRQNIVLLYKGVSGEEIEREIEPVGVFNQNNYWYIFGFCLLRMDYRQFRTDRIIQITNTSRRFSKQHGKLSDYLDNYVPQNRIYVKLLVNPKTAHFLSHSKYHYGYVSEEITEDGIIMTFETPEINMAFPRWCIYYADCLTVLEPQELKENVKEIFLKLGKYIE